MRIFVLGSSHAACLKNAWDRVRCQFPEVSLCFFADRGRGLRELAPSNGALVPQTKRLREVIAHTSGGYEQIRPSEADGILLFGLGLRVLGGGGCFHSRAVRRLAWKDSARRSTAFDVLRKLKKVAAVPAWLTHNPLPAGGPHSGEPVEDYLAAVSLLNERVFGPLGGELIAQPRSTVIEGFRTPECYSAGSVKLDIGDERSGLPHRDHDIYHMNADFGEIVLRDFLGRIGVKARKTALQ